MFTGIIETVGTIREIRQEGGNRQLLVASKISHELRVDQSVSHNGVCLTVTKVESGAHWVTAIAETLRKSSLGDLKAGAIVNLERSMPASGRFDGHIVQGHVDQQAVVVEKKDERGSFRFEFEYDQSRANITVEKGSICVDGVSLTCFDCRPGRFAVAIIPYTLENTSFASFKVGDRVNLEFDIIGKYVSALLARNS
jgi:riboflavin synthase